MQTIIRQSVGIDIAKKSFTACLCKQYSNCKAELTEVVEFENAKKGFNQLVKWVGKNAVLEPKVVFVMEATGIYYESLAHHLYNLGRPVCVVLPNKVKHYGKSLNVKSKTDVIDARVIAQMGAERILEQWQPAPEVFKRLRDLTRLYSDLKNHRTVFSNRLQSTQAGHAPLPFIIESNKALIKKIDLEIKKCDEAIHQLISSESWLEEKVKKLLTIKGAGFITIAIIIAETQGFKLIKNVKQLASYAGYDVIKRESGSSVKGKTRISKKGNSRIRAALHFPALVASRHNKEMKTVYTRINEGKASKMIGATALQRKLLILIYSLWKQDTAYTEKETITTSGNQETKPLLRLKYEVLAKKAGRPTSLPAQDELPSNQSTEALLRLT